MHIIACAEIGADVATCPLNPILDLLKHPLTDIGLEKFLSDYKKLNG
jgi:transaldolase